MSVMRLGLPLLGFLLLAAHSLRIGEYGLVAAWLGMAALLFARREWGRIVAMIALGGGVLVWGQIGAELVNIRLAMGLPWMRLACIMAGVALVSFLGMLILSREKTKELFSLGCKHSRVQATTFCLAVSALGFVSLKVKAPLLLLERYMPGWGWVEVFLLGLYAAWISGLMLDPGQSRKVRPRIWALFSLVFFLQLACGLLGMEQMLMTGKLHLPVPALIVGGPLYRGHGFFMPILYGVTLILVGGAWCSHLCYIGAWDDLLSRKVRKRPAPLPVWAKWTRPVNLLLVGAAALGLKASGLSVGVAILLAVVFGIVGVGVMVFVSSRLGMMAHCTAFCPIGIISNIAGRLSPWRIHIDKDCDRCGACSAVCRYNALTVKDLELNRPGLSCTLCGDCVGVCRKSRMGYWFPWMSRDKARATFIVLVVSLHTLFLGVARI